MNRIKRFSGYLKFPLSLYRKYISGFIVLIEGEFWVVDWASTRRIRERIFATFEQTGRSFPNSFGEGRAYVRLRQVSQAIQVSTELSFSIWLSTVGHFGNFVIQLGNAAALAKVGEGREILVTAKSFGKGRWRPKERDFSAETLVNRNLGEVTFRYVGRLKKQGVGPIEVIWRTNAMKSQDIYFEPWGKQAKDLRNSLRAALGIRHVRPSRADTLTIHLRGGDIFSNRPHPNYGQPPWSFYELLLSNHGPWNSVRVVTEDLANPVLLEIREWCTKRKVEFCILGDDFTESIKEIARAKNLAVSNSTFVAAVCFVFPSKRSIFAFEGPVHPFLLSPENRTVLYRDAKRRYFEFMLRRNWANSDFQRRLMVVYPSEFLAHPDVSSSQA